MRSLSAPSIVRLPAADDRDLGGPTSLGPRKTAPMLVLKPNCERCGRNLPPESREAMICSLETTYCSGCATHLDHQCELCGGVLEKRPTRSPELLARFPAGLDRAEHMRGREARPANSEPRRRGGIL
jgi:hypothetical protein